MTEARKAPAHLRVVACGTTVWGAVVGSLFLLESREMAQRGVVA